MGISDVFTNLSSTIFGGEASDNLLGGIIRAVEQVINGVVGLF